MAKCKQLTSLPFKGLNWKVSKVLEIHFPSPDCLVAIDKCQFLVVKMLRLVTPSTFDTLNGFYRVTHSAPGFRFILNTA